MKYKNTNVMLAAELAGCHYDMHFTKPHYTLEINDIGMSLSHEDNHFSVVTHYFVAPCHPYIAKCLWC